MSSEGNASTAALTDSSGPPGVALAGNDYGPRLLGVPDARRGKHRDAGQPSSDSSRETGAKAACGRRVTLLPREARPYLIALGALWVAPLLLVAVLHLTLPNHNSDGQCEGIGFGCRPSPADGFLLLGAFAEPFLFWVGVVTCALIAVRQRFRSQKHTKR